MQVTGTVRSSANGDPIAGANVIVETGYTYTLLEVKSFMVTASASGKLIRERIFLT
jgi:hypothetical protein